MHHVQELPAFCPKLLENMSHRDEGTKHQEGRSGVIERGAPTQQSEGKPREAGARRQRARGQGERGPRGRSDESGHLGSGAGGLGRPVVGGSHEYYDPQSHGLARSPRRDNHLLVSFHLTLLKMSCHPRGTKGTTRLPEGCRGAPWPGSALRAAPAPVSALPTRALYPAHCRQRKYLLTRL